MFTALSNHTHTHTHRHTRTHRHTHTHAHTRTHTHAHTHTHTLRCSSKARSDRQMPHGKSFFCPYTAERQKCIVVLFSHRTPCGAPPRPGPKSRRHWAAVDRSKGGEGEGAPCLPYPPHPLPSSHVLLPRQRPPLRPLLLLKWSRLRSPVGSCKRGSMDTTAVSVHLSFCYHIYYRV